MPVGFINYFGDEAICPFESDFRRNRLPRRNNILLRFKFFHAPRNDVREPQWRRQGGIWLIKTKGCPCRNGVCHCLRNEERSGLPFQDILLLPVNFVALLISNTCG